MAEFWGPHVGDKVWWDGLVIGEVSDVTQNLTGVSVQVKLSVHSAPWLNAYSVLSIEGGGHTTESVV